MKTHTLTLTEFDPGAGREYVIDAYAPGAYYNPRTKQIALLIRHLDDGVPMLCICGNDRFPADVFLHGATSQPATGIDLHRLLDQIIELRQK